MPHALVTGTAGFIGSHLSERLLAAGDRVTGIDNFSDHYERDLKSLNLEGLVGKPGFELLNADLASGQVASLMPDVDVVYHLAARPGVRDSWIDFDDYVEANIAGSKAVFEAAARNGVRVVYASSSSVYGDAPALPVDESQRPHPISPYGASKAMSELLAGAYASTYRLDAVGLRYFTVYGPRQRPDMAMSRFIEAVTAGRPISIYGDGLQRRDMTYVGDVVAATMAAAQSGRPGSVYNVASGAPLSLVEILEQLAQVLGQVPDLTYEDAKPGDVRDTWGDISLARAELGYEPGVPLRLGLERQAEEASRRRDSIRKKLEARGSG